MKLSLFYSSFRLQLTLKKTFFGGFIALFGLFATPIYVMQQASLDAIEKFACIDSETYDAFLKAKTDFFTGENSAQALLELDKLVEQDVAPAMHVRAQIALAMGDKVVAKKYLLDLVSINYVPARAELISLLLQPDVAQVRFAENQYYQNPAVLHAFAVLNEANPFNSLTLERAEAIRCVYWNQLTVEPVEPQSVEQDEPVEEVVSPEAPQMPQSVTAFFENFKNGQAPVPSDEKIQSVDGVGSPTAEEMPKPVAEFFESFKNIADKQVPPAKTKRVHFAEPIVTSILEIPSARNRVVPNVEEQDSVKLKGDCPASSEKNPARNNSGKSRGPVQVKGHVLPSGKKILSRDSELPSSEKLYPLEKFTAALEKRIFGTVDVPKVKVPEAQEQVGRAVQVPEIKQKITVAQKSEIKEPKVKKANKPKVVPQEVTPLDDTAILALCEQLLKEREAQKISTGKFVNDILQEKMYDALVRCAQDNKQARALLIAFYDELLTFDAIKLTNLNAVYQFVAQPRGVHKQVFGKKSSLLVMDVKDGDLLSFKQLIKDATSQATLNILKNVCLGSSSVYSFALEFLKKGCCIEDMVLLNNFLSKFLLNEKKVQLVEVQEYLSFLYGLNDLTGVRAILEYLATVASLTSVQLDQFKNSAIVSEISGADSRLDALTQEGLHKLLRRFEQEQAPVAADCKDGNVSSQDAKLETSSKYSHDLQPAKQEAVEVEAVEAHVAAKSEAPLHAASSEQLEEIISQPVNNELSVTGVANEVNEIMNILKLDYPGTLPDCLQDLLQEPLFDADEVIARLKAAGLNAGPFFYHAGNIMLNHSMHGVASEFFERSLLLGFQGAHYGLAAVYLAVDRELQAVEKEAFLREMATIKTSFAPAYARQCYNLVNCMKNRTYKPFKIMQVCAEFLLDVYALDENTEHLHEALVKLTEFTSAEQNVSIPELAQNQRRLIDRLYDAISQLPVNILYAEMGIYFDKANRRGITQGPAVTAKAIKLLEKFHNNASKLDLDLEPQFVENVRLTLARLYWYLCKQDPSQNTEKVWNKILCWDPNHEVALFSKGVCLIKTNRGKEGLDFLLRAANLGYEPAISVLIAFHIANNNKNKAFVLATTYAAQGYVAGLEELIKSCILESRTFNNDAIDQHFLKQQQSLEQKGDSKIAFIVGCYYYYKAKNSSELAASHYETALKYLDGADLNSLAQDNAYKSLGYLLKADIQLSLIASQQGEAERLKINASINFIKALDLLFKTKTVAQKELVAAVLKKAESCVAEKSYQHMKEKGNMFLKK